MVVRTAAAASSGHKTVHRILYIFPIYVNCLILCDYVYLMVLLSVFIVHIYCSVLINVYYMLHVSFLKDLCLVFIHCHAMC